MGSSLGVRLTTKNPGFSIFPELLRPAHILVQGPEILGFCASGFGCEATRRRLRILEVEEPSSGCRLPGVAFGQRSFRTDNKVSIHFVGEGARVRAGV